jgi:tRNA pseudouridine32 synthase/23S rRNA pseudouridine746 synthase
MARFALIAASRGERQRPSIALSGIAPGRVRPFLLIFFVPSPDLLYRDEFLLVAVKPAGLLAVPGRGEEKQDCLSSRLQKAFADALVVHRLDMATSGLMVFARGVEMQRRLSRLFHDRLVEKRYVALAKGELAPALGEIALPLAADWPNRPKQKVDHQIGKRSLTRYRVLTYHAESDVTRVELTPVTGRTHQLRVHLAAIGHPIVGDALYGGGDAPRLLLHAGQLAFDHPLTGEPLGFASAAPF